MSHFIFYFFIMLQSEKEKERKKKKDGNVGLQKDNLHDISQEGRHISLES